MKTADILKPFGEYKTPGPNEDVIEMLNDALVKAKAGEVICAAVMLLTPNGKVYTETAIGSGGMAEMVGAIDMMKDDVKDAWRELDG